MLYPILNRISPIPITTKLNILKHYLSPILAYADSSWAPFIFSSHWRKIKPVQNIGIRTMQDMPTFVKNLIFLKSTNFESIQHLIRSHSKTMFYKNSFSNHNYIRLLGKTISPPSSKLTRILKLYPFT
jgi:hypothetical protein